MNADASVKDLALLVALDDLVRAVQTLDETLDRSPAGIDDLIEAWAWLDHPATDEDEGGMTQRLNKIRDALKAKIAPIMASANETTRVTEFGIVHQSKPPKPKGFDNERLVRDVLDSRIADGNGEVIDETPTEKLEMVFSMTGHTARKTALKARGLDLLDYADDPDWQKPTVRWAR